ncbi:MAG TPA: phage holin family protein [Oscillospiraceae bacterium]|nr:phage holin family protein [Oscillospiraceae bacterium]
MRFLIRWLISAVSIYIIANLSVGVTVLSFKSTIMASAILGIVNVVIKPILIILTLPINIITLGLFTFVINGITLIITSYIVDGFDVKNIFAAIVASILISIVNVILTNLVGVRN